MGITFDYAPERPANIEAILNSLERYNPETTTVFQDYVSQQCEDKTYDCYANLALLKLYQFNPHLLRDDTVTSILTKSLTVFPAPDFSLALHLLPPHILGQASPSNPLLSNKTNGTGPKPVETPLVEAIHKLTLLNMLLEGAEYDQFWETLDSDDLYTDLVSDVAGFEELMRVRIAITVGQVARSISRSVVEDWLNLRGKQFESFVKEICGWGLEGGTINVPLNRENEAKSSVVREDVNFPMFERVVRRGFEVGVE